LLGFALLFISVMMQIVWRYVLEIPLPWSDEAARYLLVWISLLAIAIAFRDDSHIRLDFFFNRFAPHVRHIIWVIFNLLSLVFLALLFFYGIPNAIMGKFTFSPGLSNLLPNTTVTLFVPYLSVPVTGGIMILNLVDYVLFNFKIKELGDSRAREKS